MATAESVAAKLEGLISAANATTGKTDADLTTAINSLISGFGGEDELRYDIGEFTPASNVSDLKIINGIPHQLGEPPDFVLVWTEEASEYSEDNPNTRGIQVNIGYFYAAGLFGIPQRLTMELSSDYETFISFAIAQNEYRISLGSSNSLTYVITEEYAPTSEKIGLPRLIVAGRGAWISGMKYKYFVAQKWWTTGQEG